MFGKLTSGVALGWFGRRILDWGGWLGTTGVTLFTLFNSLPAPTQAAIGRAWEGNWQEITLGSLVPLAALVFSQVQSFRSTVKPQIVTEDGQKADTRVLSGAKRVLVEQVAETAIEKKAANPGPFGGWLKKLTGK